ncbi:MAG: DNA polymerase IV [Cytophagales bacterium]|nr:DNA polymerase IV [Cytophagales bacterium]
MNEENSTTEAPARKIIHIDMDAFYASVEQMDNPELRGKPVAVGGGGQRGVVAAASYEARVYGVKSALPSVSAIRRCPDLIFVKPRFDRYKELSDQIREVFFSYTDIVEPLSLDEAFLDVTTTKKGKPSATLIARDIKQEIKSVTGLTASAGVSFNKFLAKTASDMDKPDGLYVILPKDADAFTARLPINKFFGIGKVTAEKMKLAGILTGKDLRKYDLSEMARRFGKAGTYYYNICRGVDLRGVKAHRERKSVSVENTYRENFMKLEDVLAALNRLNESLFKRYNRHKIGKTLTIKIKYGDFQQITRSKTLENGIHTPEQVEDMTQELVTEKLLRPEGIRLLGVGISNFIEETQEPQLTLSF